MKKFLTLVALSLIFVTPTKAQSSISAKAAEILQKGLTQTANSFILPGYQRLEKAAHSLAVSLESYCEQGGGIGPVHQNFALSYLAWQRISVIQLGAVMDAEGPMRFQLWPDPKGFSLKAIRRAIKKKDPALLSENGLEKRSIALVNYSALEHLIFDDLAPGRYGCSLSMAIATYQAQLASEMVSNWSIGSAFRRDFDTASGGNARFADVEDPMRKLLAGMVVYVDQLRKFKIGRPLGSETGQARPERAEAKKSGLGLASIAASFGSLSDIYLVPNGVFDIAPRLGATNEGYVLGKMGAKFADVLSSQEQSLIGIVREDGDTAEMLRGYGGLLLYHEAYLKEGLPGFIGMTIGFTSSDGD